MPAARKTALTDRSLQALRADPTGRYTVWDAVLPGLAVRVSGKGKRSFYAVRRRAGAKQPSWVLLGVYPAMGLAEARAAAREALGALTEGKTPITQSKQRQLAQIATEGAAEDISFGLVAERFILQYVQHLRSARSTENVIRAKLIPALGHRPIREIRRRDIIALVEGVAAHNGIAAARRAHATIGSLFNWAITRDIEGLDANPAARCKILPPTSPRDRVLSNAELRAIWTGTDALGTPWREFFRALMLTGQRRGEIGYARLPEIDLTAATLTLPAERMKGKTAHVVPLAPAVLDLLAGLPRFSGGDFVFTTTAGRRPIGAISQAKERLDAAVGGTVAPWRTHDLRRTMRTGLSTLGITPFIAELVIGHTQSGVHAVYDLHRYDDEKRAALLAWEKRLLEIVAPGPANIERLRARA